MNKPEGFEAIIGSSKAILESVQKAAAAAQYEFPILLTGETGTGKELFARAIHRSSPVAKGPFIVSIQRRFRKIFWNRNCLATARACLQGA